MPETTNQVPAILGFQGKYRFLSNFWPCVITSKAGLVFQSSESAYQATKCADPEDMKSFCCLYASQAKRAGKMIPMRADWNEIKLHVMCRILTQKFAPCTVLAINLLNTGDAYLEETNSWSDTYWGVCRGKGANHMGKLLMQIRTELRTEPS